MTEAVPIAERWASDAENGNQFRVVPPEESFIMDEVARRSSREDAEDFAFFARREGKLRGAARVVSDNPDFDVLQLAEAVESLPPDGEPVREMSY